MLLGKESLVQYYKLQNAKNQLVNCCFSISAIQDAFFSNAMLFDINHNVNLVLIYAGEFKCHNFNYISIHFPFVFSDV